MSQTVFLLDRLGSIKIWFAFKRPTPTAFSRNSICFRCFILLFLPPFPFTRWPVAVLFFLFPSFSCPQFSSAGIKYYYFDALLIDLYCFPGLLRSGRAGCQSSESYQARVYCIESFLLCQLIKKDIGRHDTRALSLGTTSRLSVISCRHHAWYARRPTTNPHVLFRFLRVLAYWHAPLSHFKREFIVPCKLQRTTYLQF